jgi:hypothetical protein
MGRGGWEDPRARATRGLRKPSLDVRSWIPIGPPLAVKMEVKRLGTQIGATRNVSGKRCY